MVASVSPEIHEFNRGPGFSYFGKVFNVDWDKVHLFVDLALVTSAVAYSFFMNFPPLVVGGLVSCYLVILIIYNKAQWTRPSQTRIDALEAKCKQYSKTLEEKIIGSEVSNSLQEKLIGIIDKVGDKAAEASHLQRKIETYTRQKNELRRRIIKYCTEILESGELARRKDRDAIIKIMKAAQKA